MAASDQGRSANESSLARVVGTWGLVAAIANVTIGGGIFRLPAVAAASLGAAAPLAYVVCAVAMGLIVLCIAEAGSRVSLTGGPYAYVEMAFGPYFGFMTGVLLWLLGTTAVAAVSGVFADNAMRMVPALEGTGSRSVLLVIAFAVTAAINVMGVRQGNRLNAISTVAKLLPLVLLVAVGILAVRSQNFAVTSAPTVGTVTRASIVLIFAFAGVESALVPSGEVRDPARTVPRAIFIAMLGITLLYILLQVVAQGVLGSALVGSTTPLADAAAVVFGPWGRTMLLMGVVISTFGYLSGMTLAVPRALFAFARDGFLPPVFGTVHPTWRTPWVAILVQSALCCILAITSGFGSLAIIANVAALLVYFACAVAAWQLRRTNVQSGGIPFRVPGAAFIPLVTCIVIVALLSSITRNEWIVLLEIMGAATIVFFVSRAVRRNPAPGRE